MREHFPYFKKHPDLIYLDSAATAHKPSCVIDALTKFYSEDYGTVHRAVYRASLKATDQYNESRVTAAQFVNGDAHEIIFTRGTTDAINLIAKWVKPGEEVLISEMEHHSNIVPWQLAGAKLKWIPMNEQGVLEWQGCITPETKWVSLAHISNVTGTINPIAEIAKEAKKVGAKFVVDGAQAAPHIPIDVKALGCDFYAFSGHKCYGPTGIGVLWGRRELLEQMPPVQSGGDMIEHVDLQGSTFQEPPLRFEAGTPIIASAIALKSALDFVMQNRDPERERQMMLRAAEGLKTIKGLRILGNAPEKGAIVTFAIDGVHPLDIATYLDMKNIAVRSGHLCAQPLLKKFGLQHAVRASFGMYNTSEEVDSLVQRIKSVAK
jgi:cysteine desulfurase/selenocysteine lyase